MKSRLPRFSVSGLTADAYRLLLVVAVLVYVVIFADLAFDLHTGMRTHKADLGQMDQAIWNTSRGRFLEAVDGDFVSTRLTDHVEPIFALISPIFWVWDDVRALLLLQVVMVAVGAFPLYALALEKLNQLLTAWQRARIWQRDPVEQLTRPLALALALAYLLAPQLQAALLTEFHAIPLSVPLILWAFWAVERRRWWQFAVAALLVTAVKEEAALLGAGLGVWAMWRIAVSRWKAEPATAGPRSAILVPLLVAASVTVLSLAWFYVATFVIVPAHAVAVYEVAESSYFQRYGALGSSPTDIVKSVFTQPQLVWQIASEPARAKPVWGLLAVFGLLSLLAPEILLLSLPILLANQLSAYPAQYYGEFHYSAPVVAYFAVAAAYGMARLWRFLARRINQRSGSFQYLPANSAATMAVVSLFTNAATALRPLLTWGFVLWLLLWSGWRYADAGFGPGGGRYSPTPVTAHHRLLPRFVDQIPAQAAVSATAAVHPHVSHRRYVYQFPWGVEPNERADWALLDVTTNTDMAPGDLKATVDGMLARDWGIVDAADGFLLLRRGAGVKEIPDPFYDFARTRAPATESSLAARTPITFGPLTAVGVELEDWPRWRQTKVTTLWQVEQSFIAGGFRPWVELTMPDGALLHTYQDVPPPALVWYPSALWQPGEMIRIETPWLFLPQAWGVAVGVNNSPDPADLGGGLAVDALQNQPALGIRTPTLALVAAYARRPDGALHPLPIGMSPLPEAAHVAAATRLRQVNGVFAAEHSARITAWLTSDPVAAGQPFDLWLRWQSDSPLFFDPYQVFVHLRQEGVTVTQNDGLPRYFLPVTGLESLPDWRQLPLPRQLSPGTYDVVVGVYDPGSGERMQAFDAAGNPVGNELSLGQLVIEPPLVPDQACALIPATCAGQPR